MYDDKETDISNWVLKYNTRSDFKRSDLILCSIDSTTINESVLRALETIPEMPLYSLQYLVSEAYKHMISDHKIKDNLKSQTYRSIQSYQEFLSIINSYEESTDG